MIFRGLKSNIVFVLFFLLTTAMLLIGLVMIGMTKKELVKAEVIKGRMILADLSEHFLPVFSSQANGSDVRLPTRFLSEKINFSCISIVYNDGREMLSFSGTCDQESIINEQALSSLQSARSLVRLHENHSGIFSRGDGYLLLSEPVISDEKVVGVVAAKVDLNRMYGNVHQVRNIFFVYFFANLIILVLLGFYWLYGMTVRPIQKMVDLIEGFRDTEDFFFPDPKNDTEFQKLNKSMQRMVRRFTRNREELRATVTSLEDSNRNLHQAQREIIRAEKLASVGRLSAGIAHEIGNPIGIILGYFELLKNKDLPEDDRDDFLARAEKEVNRINTIIRQLLDLSRSSSDMLQVFSVHSILHDLSQVVNMQPLMAEIDLILELTAENDFVSADAGQLRQVFLNLIINAADAMAGTDNSSKGRLIIKTVLVDSGSQGNARLLISFTDNGPGISEDVIDTIFDPFFTTKDPGKGTGLGLAVSFMIIESFGGAMEVNSTVGKGTTMSIFLPVEPVAHAESGENNGS